MIVNAFMIELDQPNYWYPTNRDIMKIKGTG